MQRILSSRWVIALGVLLAVYGTAGISALIREAGGTLFLRTGMPIRYAAGDLAPELSSEQVTVEVALDTASAASPVIPSAASSETSTTQDLSTGEDNPTEQSGGSVRQIPIRSTPELPERLVIASIELDAPVVPAEMEFVNVGGRRYRQWLAPDRYAAGWHPDSALLGEAGNTVLNGHHNVAGEVFGRLVDVEIGDVIQVHSAQSIFTYQVTNKMILPEKYEQIDVRMENAQWILPSRDERLTLITCWPRESNTHRLIIVAKPLYQESLLQPLE